MKSRGVPFQPGNHFGQGRPKGSRNKALLVARRLFAEHADSIFRKCIADAVRGNPRAMELCIRVLAPQREAVAKLKLPSITTISGVTEALSILLQAAAAGKLTPVDAGKLAEIVQNSCRIIASVEHENRLQALELTSRRKSDKKSKGE